MLEIDERRESQAVRDSMANSAIGETVQADYSNVVVRLEEFADEPGFVRETIDLFVEVTKETTARLIALLKAGEWKDCKLHAHTIKGSAWNVGADRLAEIAFTIEKALDSTQPESAASSIPALRDEFAQLCIFLNELAART